MAIVDDGASVLFSHHLQVDEVSNFFLKMDAAREEPDVTHLKLQKLLYFAQANFLASTDQRLFDEDLEAFRHGPVVYKAYQRFSGSDQIIVARDSSFQDVASPHVPADSERFLHRVWNQYKDFSAGQLRNLTHMQDPWRDNYVEGAYRELIPDKDLASYFRQKVAAKDRVFHEAVVLVPAGFVEALDEDDIAAQMRSFWA
ncbi:Panacea domain-containing protein [Arthrobacter zhaoguopingii]|uniref:Panacea domain-containing protein n=1 Tax=Arthrobacter zhaoguopingii TaxID=2681491 RepID=UPI001358575C|nr:type II toxin-antitoxin system antitoxin SocA domain-containing protein [Arthrobacter zhaoguopingii]